MQPKLEKPWYKFKDDPLARVFFGGIMLFVSVKGNGGMNLASAEASGHSAFSVFMIVLCVWLIVSGVKIYKSHHFLNTSSR